MSKEPYDPMDLKALRCFEAMAKHGSLTRASIELGISDAAVSQRITDHVGSENGHQSALDALGHDRRSSEADGLQE